MDALIFDFDGTIVDTEPLHEAALRAALEPWSIPVREGMTIGMSDEDAIRRACDEAGRPHLEGREVREVFEAKVTQFVRSMDPGGVIVYPGAVELLRAAAERLPVAVCTAAMRDEVVPILEHLGIAEVLGALVTADEVTRKKPAPDAYALACGRLRAGPGAALAIEDSPRGVASARDAGCVVLALEHTTPREQLGRAHEVIASTQGLTFERLLEVHAAHAV